MTTVATNPEDDAATSAFHRHWRLAVLAIGIILMQRGILLAWALQHGVQGFYRWDADWYLDVATHGYAWPVPPGPHGEPGRSNLAFFPLLPMGASFLHSITGVEVRPLLEGIALIGLPLAAWGIAAVGTAVANRRTGLIMVALWGAAPRAFVTIMPYTESLFTACAAWCLYWLLRQRWWLAAMCCALAGVTRSSASILIVTLAASWFWSRRRDLLRPITWMQGLGLAMVSVSGLLAYMAYVARRTGQWSGYVQVQRDWLMQLGSPLVAWHQVPRMWHAHYDWAAHTYAVIVAVAAVVLMLAMLTTRPRLPLWLYGTLTVVWTWSAQNYFWAKPRFLLPAFSLALAPALLLSRAPRWLAVIMLALLTGLQVVTDTMMWLGPTSP